MPCRKKFIRQVGIQVDNYLVGPQVEAMSDDELTIAARTTQVFARLNPQQKVRVIQALHRDNHVVGFLGDGINDGPALRAADVGISVELFLAPILFAYMTLTQFVKNWVIRRFGLL